MIPFNKPTLTGKEEVYFSNALAAGVLCGDGPYSQKCTDWFEERLNCPKVLLTPSCTAALEMAAILLDIRDGDEVIVPSYTFVSTANAFVLRGAKIVFVDIRPDTMNIDETLIEAAITSKTKAIVPVHYAGVACEMDVIMELASRYGIYVVEDAAQGMMSTYKGRPLGTIGHFGCYSFHATKNYTSGGEGGLLIVNDKSLAERAQVIREKGTNRSRFFRGMVDKYTWVDLGSSYLMNEVSAAFLYAQLELADGINLERLNSWNLYNEHLFSLSKLGYVELPTIPLHCEHNAHMYYIKVNNLDVRKNLISYLNTKKISACFHYVPLHSSDMGKKIGLFKGNDNFTTSESERLIRIPLYHGIRVQDILYTVDTIKGFFIR